ncbi:CheY-P phosphatase CheX [Anaerolineae bacterium]|nr:CheY-P phosphatase CheX [Anaerolineae bacterium]
MRIDFVSSFVEASLGVLGTILGSPAAKGEMTLETGLAQRECFSVSFGLTGDIEGTVLFDTKEQTAIDIAGAMNGRGFESMEPLVLDSMAELMNMIIGNSVTLLNEKGYKLSLTPPSIIWGKDLKLFPINLETLKVPLHSSKGSITISLSMRPR